MHYTAYRVPKTRLRDPPNRPMHRVNLCVKLVYKKKNGFPGEQVYKFRGNNDQVVKIGRGICIQGEMPIRFSLYLVAG